MITARRTRLVRVPDLHAFRRTTVALCALEPEVTGAPVVIVPSRAAAGQLARTAASGAGTRAPSFVTREQFHDVLHARLANPPGRLTAFDRSAIMHRAAVDAASEASALPFRVGPGLVAEILRFYDQLRRQSQQVKRFQDLIEEALGGESAAEDRGSARLLQQTRFLARTFGLYEAARDRSGACDEHSLRDVLMREAAPHPVRHVLVTVADWIAEPQGLYVADFDLLARVPGLEAIDIVCTAGVLGSGFHERVHSWFPGIEEADGASIAGAHSRMRPVLLTPPAAEQLWFTERDREEELVRVARRVRAAAPINAPLIAPLDQDATAVVFKNPLPYLYLAPETLGAAGLRYQSGAALPLAAEPAAAAVDLLLDLVETDFTRRALVAVLRSPQLTLGEPLTREGVSALDRLLSRHRYLGGRERLEQMPVGESDADAVPALNVARSAARRLAELRGPARASMLIRLLREFMIEHAPPAESTSYGTRTESARSTIAALLERLASAHDAHYDPEWTIDDLAVAVRSAIEGETFVASIDPAPGIHLLDDQAVRYGDFEHIALVGLVENEWPERPRRNIFYSADLLKALGWPTEKDRRAGDDARFLDLLTSASHRVSVSTFLLDDEAPVTRSLQLDDIPAARLSTLPESLEADETALKIPVHASATTSGSASWIALRLERPDRGGPAFHGQVEPLADRAWSVSALETYLRCPFKFYAKYVLNLDEEPEDEEVMDPRRQGQIVHEVFEEFFRQWHESGGGTITPENIDAARAQFSRIVDEALEPYSEAEAGLERTRLLGSSAAAGLGDSVFRMEAERPVPVIERLLERSFERPLTIATAGGPRTVTLRAKADRIDLLADGTFRLIDYKLGSAPKANRALQLPIYSLSAEAELGSYKGRRWTLAEAAYLAFRGPKRVVPLFTTATDREKVLADAQQRLADTLDHIARGEFPPTPEDVFWCESCDFAAVCRKDHVGDV